jgi:hypothetical protein
MVFLGYHYSSLAHSVNKKYEAVDEAWGELNFSVYF